MSDDGNVATKVIAKVGIWWPAGDETGLRAAAGMWRVFAEDVDLLSIDATGAARDLVGTNSGPAVDAFEVFWARYDGGPDAYLPALATAGRAMGTALDRYADTVHEAKRKLEEMAVVAGATVLVGTVLAVFTFGASEAAVGEITADLIAAAEALSLEVSADAASIVATVLADSAIAAAESTILDIAVAQPIRVLAFHGGGFSLTEVEQALKTGAEQGALRGLTRGLEPPASGIQEPRRLRLKQVTVKDIDADLLSKKIGGVSRVSIDGSGPREYDVITDKYIAQAKPANYVYNEAGRKQMKATFEKAIETGRTPYFHYEGPPDPRVIRKLHEYAERYGIEPVIDTEPLRGNTS